MPIYMDVHIVPGVTAKDVAEAHKLDLGIQHEHSCKCMTYWLDEQRESIFCLIEAPSKEAVEEMHNKAHGLIPNKVIEVSSELVETFLGRIYDPADAPVTSDGLKVFTDTAFRVLVVVKTDDPVLLQNKLGKEEATGLLSKHRTIVKRNIAQFAGKEVEHTGAGFIISFTSASKAFACAIAIQNDTNAEEKQELSLSIGIHGGEPIEKSNQLFGDTIRLANILSSLSSEKKIRVSAAINELVSKETHIKDAHSISPQDETFLNSLYHTLEHHLQNPDFDVEEYCQAMAMSKSQLYRKTVDLTGSSPNQLVKDYRLEKAKELLRQKRHSISQVTFDTGFTSPSYFTKCFKAKYGLLPMNYVELV